MAFTEPKIWDTSTLMGVMRELEPVNTYWLDLLFPGAVTFDDEYIDFERIPHTGRKLAPFVAPLAQGKPIMSEGSKVTRLKPAYIKVSDPVTPSRVMQKRPGNLLGNSQQSAGARYNAIKADIVRTHRDSIWRRWEWMAAKAIIDGQVTLEGDDYPTQVVDFGRDGGHTITKGVGTRWGDSGVSIIDDIQGWMDMCHKAQFGGAITRMTMGLDAWAAFRKDAEIKDLLDTRYRGDSSEVKRGLIGNGEVRYAGMLDGGLELYVYNDYYEQNGSEVAMMSAKDVVLSGPAVEGFRCFGAIQDAHAQFRAEAIFPRNWLPQTDPAVEQVLHQSAPLMVPMRPNATLKATVVA